MAANYPKTSPWSTTKANAGYLEYLKIRPVPASDDDLLYEIDSRFTHRPDLLSYELYGTTKLWWVFAQRNMDVLKDPIYDMVPGVEIYLPRGADLRRLLGV